MKTLSILKPAAAVAALAMSFAASGYDFLSDGIYYNFVGSDLEVTSGAYEYYGDVVIPSEALYYGEYIPVTSVGVEAFKGCADVTSITLPATITRIGDRAFEGCASLASVGIPESVVRIGERAFDGTAIYNAWTGDALYVDHALVKVSPSLTGDFNVKPLISVIADGAFAGCAKLKGVTLPDDLRRINAATFQSCQSLTTVILPLTMEHVEEYAFYGCGKLSFIEIPENVSYIGDYAFGRCPSLVSIKLYQPNPYKLKLGNRVFDGMDQSKCRLSVVEGSADAYSKMAQWSDFAEIAEFKPVLRGDTNYDGDVNVFDLSGIVNRMLGVFNPGFSLQGADVNADNHIDVSDMTMIISLMLNR